MPLRRRVLHAEQPHAAPYQLCYCSICRTTAGGGGFAINITGLGASLAVDGRDTTGVFRAPLPEADGSLRPSHGQRPLLHAMRNRALAHDERWPDLLHPFASALDTPLPSTPLRVHLKLADGPAWAALAPGPDQCFDQNPEQSIEDWHKAEACGLSAPRGR